MKALVGFLLTTFVSLTMLAQCTQKLGLPLPVTVPDVMNVYTPEQDSIIGLRGLHVFEANIASVSGASFHRVDELQIQGYLEHILARLLSVAPQSAKRFKYTLALYDMPELNALHFGGGVIAIMLGTVSKIASEDFIAAVIAHELGHATHRHPTAFLTQEHIYTSQGMPSLKVKFLLDRMKAAQEVEAEVFGIRLMMAAGYNSTAAMNYFRTYQSGGGSVSKRAALIACEMQGHELPEETISPEFLVVRARAHELLLPPLPVTVPEASVALIASRVP